MTSLRTDITRQIRFWMRLGWYDILSRYRSTVLGVFWIVFMNGLTIFAIGLVYGTLFGIELNDYFPYLSVGYIVWLWISTSILEISGSFTAYRFIQISHPVDPCSIVARVFARNFIVFLHNLPILMVVLLLYVDHGYTAWLLFPLGLLLVSAFLLGTGGSIAFLCARFHDVQMIISAFISVLFLITPVIWSPEILTGRAYIATFNPLHHVLDILRKPLLGEIPDMTNYVVVGGMAVFGLAIFGLTYNACRKRYIHWL